MPYDVAQEVWRGKSAVLRPEVQLQPKFSGWILERRIGEGETTGRKQERALPGNPACVREGRCHNASSI